MKRTALLLAIVASLACLIIPAAWSQDFQKTYQLPPGGTISISNISGEITVTGYNGSGVQVSAYKEGRDKDVVQVTDESTAAKVALGVQYPKDGGNHDASIRFVVQVPIGVNYQFDSLSTASGDIKVSTVSGDLHARTASGDITISRVIGTIDAKTASGDMDVSQVQGTLKFSAASGDVKVKDASGTVNASTASGDVEVEMTKIEGNGDMKFTSASGDVTVKVPAGLSAQVDMSTTSGSVKTDFGLKVEDRQPRGQKASGLVGAGAVKLTISTVSGDARLIR